MEKETSKYVAVAYKLYAADDSGSQLVEEATVEKPFQFITGFGIALDDFEKTVYPLAKGEQFELHLSQEQAYGEYNEEKVLDLDKEIFYINGRFDHENIYKDAYVPLQNEEGKRFMGHVLDITTDKVVIDLNHPLAGMELTFKGQIVESREATNAEIESMISRLSGEGCGCGGGCGDCEGHHDHEGDNGGGCGCHHGHGGCCHHH